MTYEYRIMIHPTAIIDDGVTIGEGSKIWHFCHAMKGAQIGKNCILGHGVFIGSYVIIGDNCKIQNGVNIFQGVILKDAVFVGPNVTFTNVINPRAEIERKSEYKPTIVKRGASIGAGATIICGVTLGEYCMIGAGSVVTRDVLPYSLVYGNPSRSHGWICKCGEVLEFRGVDAHCDVCGDVYVISDKRVIRLP